MNDFDAILMEIGTRGMFDVVGRRQAALTFRIARARYPNATIGFTIGGYDDDPRELYEIPEAREYIREWAREAGISDWRVAMTVPWDQGVGCLKLLQLSGAFAADSPFRVTTEPAPENTPRSPGRRSH